MSGVAASGGSAAATPRRDWCAAWRVYAQATVVRMLLLGFAAGLPLARHPVATWFPTALPTGGGSAQVVGGGCSPLTCRSG